MGANERDDRERKERPELLFSYSVRPRLDYVERQVSSRAESLSLFSQVTISVKNGSTVVARRKKKFQTAQVNKISD